jgi:hypothetical protein
MAFSLQDLDDLLSSYFTFGPHAGGANKDATTESISVELLRWFRYFRAKFAGQWPFLDICTSSSPDSQTVNSINEIRKRDLFHQLPFVV